jgi:hypothetical protein
LLTSLAKKQTSAENGGLGLQIASVSGGTDIADLAKKDRKESAQKVNKCDLAGAYLQMGNIGCAKRIHLSDASV